MLTIVVMLSGPHRLRWLRQALESIPIENPRIGRVNIVHQAGPWDWGGDLRMRFERHPKVRVLEFADRPDFGASFNRHLAHCPTTWGLLLPDDDFLIPDALDLALRKLPEEFGQCGLVAYDWYYFDQAKSRYVRARLKWEGLRSVPRMIPKFCSTMINVRHAQAIAGFSNEFGGFCDTVLFTQLAYRFGLGVCHLGVAGYRLHQNQSSRWPVNYGPFVGRVIEALRPFTGSEGERDALRRRMRSYARGEASLIQGIRQWASSGLKGMDRIEPMPDQVAYSRWSA